MSNEFARKTTKTVGYMAELVVDRSAGLDIDTIAEVYSKISAIAHEKRLTLAKRLRENESKIEAKLPRVKLLVPDQDTADAVKERLSAMYEAATPEQKYAWVFVSAVPKDIGATTIEIEI